MTAKQFISIRTSHFFGHQWSSSFAPMYPLQDHYPRVPSNHNTYTWVRSHGGLDVSWLSLSRSIPDVKEKQIFRINLVDLQAGSKLKWSKSSGVGFHLIARMTEGGCTLHSCRLIWSRIKRVLACDPTEVHALEYPSGWNPLLEVSLPWTWYHDQLVSTSKEFHKAHHSWNRVPLRRSKSGMVYEKLSVTVFLCMDARVDSWVGLVDVYVWTKALSKKFWQRDLGVWLHKQVGGAELSSQAQYRLY